MEKLLALICRCQKMQNLYLLFLFMKKDEFRFKSKNLQNNKNAFF